MKFKNLIIILFLLSCSNSNINSINSKKLYTSKGFALIYNPNDFNKKLISAKLDDDEMQVGHNKLKKNTIVIITNPTNNKSIRLKVSKKINYSDFFKILITSKVSDKLNLDPKMPFVEVEERIKNKSFVAKKAVTFSEEKKVLIKAPITKVKIDNISKSENKGKKNNKNSYSIIISDFYSKKWALSLVDILVNENISREVFKVKKLSKNSYELSAGPYSSINTLKNDYFKLNKYGFDNLDIVTNK